MCQAASGSTECPPPLAQDPGASVSSFQLLLVTLTARSPAPSRQSFWSPCPAPATCLQSAAMRLRLLVETVRVIGIPANFRLLLPRMELSGRPQGFLLLVAPLAPGTASHTRLMASLGKEGYSDPEPASR